MSQTLTEVAQQLKDANKKVQLIYAFNGAGKTRLSREFKELVSPKNENGEEPEDDQRVLSYLVNEINTMYRFQQVGQND